MGNCMQEKNERFDDYNKLFNKIIGLYKKWALWETIRSEIYKEIEDIQWECMVTGWKKKSSKKYNN
jgi:hypothetical protein